MPAPRRISKAQLEELLEWMEAHPQVARTSQMGCAQSKASTRKLWLELASLLNATECGTSKSWKEWRQYWNDLKFKVRKKGLMRQRRHTADGPSSGNSFTPIEDRIWNLIADNVGGNENSGIKVATGLNSNKREQETLLVVKKERFTNEPSTSNHPVVTLNQPRPAVRPQHITERRLALENEKLEEARQFHREMLELQKQSIEEQRTFHVEVLRMMERLVDVLTPRLPHPD